MLAYVLKYGISFLGLILLQGLVLNNVHFNGYITPYLYVLFILSLPFSTPNWVVLILGFFLGLFVDVFSSTLGMHVASCVFMAFARNYVLRLIEPRDGYDYNHLPSISDMGSTWYLTYVIVLVLAHHLFLFYVESFRFSQFFFTMGRAILSTIFTVILLLVVQLFQYKPSNRL